MSGCSMGSAFSEYISSCQKTADPASISAFATHSTGLKKKGDGLRFPGDFHQPGVQWGECSNCEYWPSVPKPFKDSLGLKACIFDNTGDGDFYKSSQALVKAWKAVGNKEEDHFGSGGHCQIHSFADIVNCLDDGTKRLLSDGPSPAPTPPSPTPPTPTPPSPTPTPSPVPPSPSPDQPPAACQKCFLDHCPSLHKAASEACRNCVTKNQWMCASSCAPYPFSKVSPWFCGDSEIHLV